MDKDKLMIGDEQMCRYDFYWDQIGGGLAERLRERGFGWHGFSEKYSVRGIRKRLTTAPIDTRAGLRSKYPVTPQKIMNPTTERCFRIPPYQTELPADFNTELTTVDDFDSK